MRGVRIIRSALINVGFQINLMSHGVNIVSSLDSAISTIKKGGMVIIVDHPSRENEGDFFFPAQTATGKKVNFILSYGRGLVCVALEKKQALRLDLPLMVHPKKNTERTSVNFTVSVNAKAGIGSGISAFDRAKTIALLASKHSKAADFTRPGHVFPLVAAGGGLRERQGHTEAAITLSRLAGFNPAGVICEILRSDGRVAKSAELQKISRKFQIPIISIDQLLKF